MAKKWILRAASVGALAAIVAVLLVRWFSAEPSYQGRPLSAWLNDLQRGSEDQRQEAAEAIRKLGPEGLPYLAGTLTNPPSPVRRVAKGIGSYLPERLKQQIRRFYRPPDEINSKLAVLYALQAMGTNGTPALGAVTQIFLEQPNVALSSSAAQTLSQFGTNSIPALVAALDDGDYNIRSLSCQALASFHTNAAPAVPRLERIARDENGPISGMAFYTLSRIGEEAVPALTNLLSSTNAAIRAQSLYALSVIGPFAATAEEWIIAATQDPVPEVRWRAVEALSTVNSENTTVESIFRGGLSDTDPRVRAASVSALGQRPRLARMNLPLLLKLLEDSSPEVRARAAFAVGQTGQWGTEGLPQLEALTSDTNATVSVSALRAIETITESKRIAGESNRKNQVE